MPDEDYWHTIMYGDPEAKDCFEGLSQFLKDGEWIIPDNKGGEMGEQRYPVGNITIQFSEMDEEWGCLCTFPVNCQERLNPDWVRSLALLGAAVVLASREDLEDETDNWFLPYVVPEWIRQEIDRVLDYHYEELEE